MTERTDDITELSRIRTCFVSTADGDVVAAFVIDGRHYTDPHDPRRVYEEAVKEMSRRRAGWEWENRIATPTEPVSTLPSWEEYRVGIDEKHPMPEADGS